MSDLTSFQPTILFAMCTLKGVIWIAAFFLPELFGVFLPKATTNNDSNTEDDDDDYTTAEPEMNTVLDETNALVLLQDHHVLFMERISHRINIIALIGLVSFYMVNPRLFQYKRYGWLLVGLLLLQYVPQTLHHEGWLNWLGRTNNNMDNNDDSNRMTTATIVTINRLFTTIGVLLFQIYCLVYGYRTVWERLVAEPLFVFFTMLTMLLETHMVCISTWIFFGTSNHSDYYSYYYVAVSSSGSLLSRTIRQLLLLLVLGGLVAVKVLWYDPHHQNQVTVLRKQWKTRNVVPKMKVV